MDAGPICPSCGDRSPPGSSFCPSCGYRLNDADDGRAAFPVDEPTTEMTLEPELLQQPAVFVVTQGSKAGSRYELTEARVTVGRHPDSDIFLDDITVSRRHAEVIREGFGRRVRDMGSLNGTYLNRRRVEDAGLKDGDELQVGRFKLVFHDRIDQ